MKTFHGVANIFPMMTDAEFASLKADIAENGLREAVWLHSDGSIIDGRNRYKACTELGITPEFRTWDGAGSLVSFVVSLNLHRRHLNSGQLAMVALDILPMLEEEARGRQSAAGTGFGRGVDSSVKELTELSTEPKRATAQAAAITGTNRQYVSDAKRISTEAPKLAAQVRAGTVTMAQATQLVKMPEEKRNAVQEKMKEMGTAKVTKAAREVMLENKKDIPPLPTGKYRVFYADPPWSYGNSGVINDSDGYGRAERHYPTMSIDELCAMGPEVKGMSDDDAVLFLWVTSPLLEECFPVIKAWGFKYKTSFVWDKVGHNYGHYNSVRHELLLVCTRGSCTPDAKELFDSVQSIEKSRNHSEKPERFREIIDTLYASGQKIELFSRQTVPGWKAWGNE